MMDKTLYDLLDVMPQATADELRRSYHLMTLAWHPDRFPEEIREQASKRMQEINAAFDTLSDEEKRQEYDSLLQFLSEESSPAQSSPSAEPFSYVRSQVFTHESEEASKPRASEPVRFPAARPIPSPVYPLRRRTLRPSSAAFLIFFALLMLGSLAWFTLSQLSFHPFASMPTNTPVIASFDVPPMTFITLPSKAFLSTPAIASFGVPPVTPLGIPSGTSENFKQDFQKP